MAKNVAAFYLWLVAVEQMEVGAADGAGGDPYDRISRVLNLGIRDSVDANVALSVRAKSAHGLSKPDTPPPDATHMFFDGPLVQALTTLREIRGSLFRMEQHQEVVRSATTRDHEEAHVRAVEKNNEIMGDIERDLAAVLRRRD